MISFIELRMTNHSFTCPLIRIIIASSDRNNPNRSIPTGFLSHEASHCRNTFQSYQSKQINPDKGRIKKYYEGSVVSIVSIKTDQSRLGSYPTKQAIVGIRFNRINSDRSIPTSEAESVTN